MDVSKIEGYDIVDAKSAADIENIKAYIGYPDNSQILGLQADFENNTFTRLAGAVGKTAGADFNSYAMYGGRRLCNLADDGTVNAWYGDQSYTEDGSNGQVMVWQPKFYYMVVPLKKTLITSTTVTDKSQGYHLKKANYYLSDSKFEGFKIHPAFLDENGNELDGIFISAYEGSVYDVSESKYLLFDDMSDDGNFTSNTYLYDMTADKFCSIAGTHTITAGGDPVTVEGVKPASGYMYNDLNRTNLESLCQNRGSRWHSENLQVHSMEMMLIVVEYGGFNTQDQCGMGVCQIEIENDRLLNGSVQTGATASLGNGSGSATKTVRYIDTGKTEYTGTYQLSVRYRGRENDWGNIYKFINGVNVQGHGDQYGGVFYYCNDFNYAEQKDSSNSDNYISTGITITTQSGYTLYFGWSDVCDWAFVTTDSTGNMAIPVGDAFMTSRNDSRYRCVYMGGFWDPRFEKRNGGFEMYCNDIYNWKGQFITGRIMYIPQITS